MNVYSGLSPRPMTIFSDNPFRPTPDTPLYQQLYTYLQAAILSGQFRGGMQLPSTPALADALGVSRNTVVNAYEQLKAEGYLESIVGSGTFVARVAPDRLLTSVDHRAATAPGSSGAITPPPSLAERARLQL